MPRVPLLVVLALALSAPGCGGGNGGDGSDGDGSDAIRDAVAETEAAKTARMSFTVSAGGTSERFNGECSWISSTTGTT